MELNIEDNKYFEEHRGLLFFWIGDTDPNTGYFITGNTTVSQRRMNDIYNFALKSQYKHKCIGSYYNGIILMHVGNNSGLLLYCLNKLQINNIFKCDHNIDKGAYTISSLPNPNADPPVPPTIENFSLLKFIIVSNTRLICK